VKDSEILMGYAEAHSERPGSATLRKYAAIARGLESGEWVILPKHATDAMVEAAEIREDEEPASDWGKIVPAPHEAIYTAMLAVAPQFQAGGSES
jgi:hypothetical protein